MIGFSISIRRWREQQRPLDDCAEMGVEFGPDFGDESFAVFRSPRVLHYKAFAVEPLFLATPVHHSLPKK